MANPGGTKEYIFPGHGCSHPGFAITVGVPPAGVIVTAPDSAHIWVFALIRNIGVVRPGRSRITCQLQFSATSFSITLMSTPCGQPAPGYFSLKLTQGTIPTNEPRLNRKSIPFEPAGTTGLTYPPGSFFATGKSG